MGRTMLHAAGFKKDMWAYAHTAAAHIHNQIPNQVTGLKTPYEALFGKKPHLDYLRTFGKPAVVHVPCEIRRKMDQRGKLMLMVGYPSGKKGWSFWDPQGGKLVTVESLLARFLSDGPPVPLLPAEPPVDSECSKRSLQHVLNTLELGKFDAEKCVEEQDDLVANMNKQVIKHGVIIPKSYTEAVRLPEATKWLQACKDELAQITEMGVWEASHLPLDKNLTDVRWVFDVKKDGRFKARLVVKGFLQVHGTDFTETFAPTATFAALRTLNVVAARYGLKVRGFDVVAAYLNSPLDHEIWVWSPPGFKMSKVMKLLKALYGTKQGAHCWWKFMDEQLRTMGFQPSQFDASFYVLRRGEDMVMIWVHFDDGAVVGTNDALIQEVEEKLSSHIKIKWEEDLKEIVGVEIQKFTPNHLRLSQPTLTKKIVTDHADLLLPITATTPVPPNLSLSSELASLPQESLRYLSIVGAISYLAVGTRPDLSFPVNFLARYAKNPQVDHWKALKHLLRYLRDTASFGLDVNPCKGTFKRPLETFVDANWGGEFARSTYGHVTRLFGVPIAWVSRRQGCVASSTCHAEFMAIGAACRDTIWLKSLVQDVIPKIQTPLLLGDNKSSVYVSRDNAANKRTRHTDREFYYINKQLYKKNVDIEWIPGVQQLADTFTKALGPLKFREARDALGVM